MFFLMSCSNKKDIPELLNGKFDQYIISFENIRTDIDLEKDKLKEILILLHHRVDVDKIKEYYKMNDSVWNERINYLLTQGLIKKNDKGKYLPTCFVFDVDNAISIKKFTDSLGIEVSEITIDRLEEIKTACFNIPSIKNIPFEKISLFVLGCVVHDYWQVKFYQDQFIKSFIPRRGNYNYYFSLFQNSNSFNGNKIYETTFLDFGNFECGVYSLDNELAISNVLKNEKLKKMYLGSNIISESNYQKIFIEDLIKLTRNPKVKLDKNKKDFFEQQGFLREGKITIPVINKQDSKKLFDVASIVTPEFANYFEGRQTLFLKKYLNSQYKDETHYKEWLTWMYKIIFTKAVNVLIKKLHIKACNEATLFIIEK